MTFNDLRLNPSLLKALSEEGYTTPTPIQQKAIPLVLERKDVWDAPKPALVKQLLLLYLLFKFWMKQEIRLNPKKVFAL